MLKVHGELCILIVSSLHRECLVGEIGFMGTLESRGRQLMFISVLIDANDDALTFFDRQLNLKGNGANAECVLAAACIMSLS